MGDLSKRSNTERIISSALLYTLISSVSLLFSFFKESILAYYFGTSADMDAFTLGIQLPVTLFGSISTVLNIVVIPTYSRELYNSGNESANKYISNLMTIFSMFGIVTVVIMILFAEQIIGIIAPGLSTGTAETTVIVFRVVLPTIITTQLMNISIAVMNVHKSFVPAALSVCVLNSIYIFTIVFLVKRFGIFAAVLGVVFGSIGQFVYITICKRRYHRYRPIVDFYNSGIKAAIKMSGPVMIGSGAAEINKLIDRVVASYLEAGSISALGYASKLSSAVSSLLVQAVTTIATPEFAESAAKNDNERLNSKYTTVIKLYLIIILPLIVGAAFLRNEIVRIIFLRGSFDYDSLSVTAPIFAIYVACLLFQSIRLAGSNYFYAIGDSKTPLKNSIIGITLNIILNISLAYYFGVFGLAMATLISSIVISTLMMVDVKKNSVLVNYIPLLKILLNSLISSAIMIIVMLLIKTIVFGGMNIVSGKIWVCIIFVILAVICGSVSYFASHLMLKTDLIIYLLGHIKKHPKLWKGIK